MTSKAVSDPLRLFDSVLYRILRSSNWIPHDASELVGFSLELKPLVVENLPRNLFDQSLCLLRRAFEVFFVHDRCSCSYQQNIEVRWVV